MKLIDRKREIETLESYFENACDGSGRLVLLSGDIGVGKAALAFELMKRHEKDAICIYTSVQKTKSIPYAPFLHNIDEWEKYIKTKDLPDMLRKELFSSTVISEFNLGMQERMFSLFEQAFKEVSENRTVIFFIDNLHWADNGTLSLLAHMAEKVQNMRTLIIGAYTSNRLQDTKFKDYTEFLTGLMMKDLLSTVHVERFQKKDVAEFINEFLDIDIIDDSFVEKMYEASKGNPLFLEYAMDLFIKEKVVQRRKGLVIPLYEINIPSSLEEIITRTLNLLPEKIATVLKYASIQGSTFLTDVLREQLKMREEEFRDALSILEKEGMIYPVDEERYGFIHNQAREIIYKTCLKKKELHREVADYIETLHADDLNTHYLELANHYFEAGAWKWAAKYAKKAGDENLRLYSLEDAIFAYNMALTALKMDKEADGVTTGKLLLMLSISYLLAGKWDQSAAAAKEALEIFEGKGSKTHIINAYLALGSVERERSNLNEASDWYQKAMELAREELDNHAMAKAARGLGYISWRWGDYERALAMLGEAEKMAKDASNPIYGTVMVDTGNVHSALGNLEKAREYYNRGVEALQDSGNLWDLARAYNNLGDSYLQTEDWERALEFFEKCSEVATKAGFNNFLGWSLFNSAEALSGKGDYQAALTYLDRSLPILQSIKDTNGLAGVYRDYGIVYLKMGDYAKAETNLLRALEYAEEADSADIILDTKIDLAELHLLNGEKNKAGEILETALKSAREMDARTKINRIEEMLERVK